MDPVFPKGQGTPNEHNGVAPLIVLALSVCSPKWPLEWYKFIYLLMAIYLTKGEKLALDPIYLGSLFTRLDECVHNILCRYDVVTHSDTCFL